MLGLAPLGNIRDGAYYEQRWEHLELSVRKYFTGAIEIRHKGRVFEHIRGGSFDWLAELLDGERADDDFEQGVQADS